MVKVDLPAHLTVSVPFPYTVTTCRTLSAFPPGGLSSVVVNLAAKILHFRSGVARGSASVVTPLVWGAFEPLPA